MRRSAEGTREQKEALIGTIYSKEEFMHNSYLIYNYIFLMEQFND